MEDLNELIRKRDAFLEENPDLKPMQTEIDKMMGTTFDPMQRLDILSMLISGKLKDMSEAWDNIREIATNLEKIEET